MQPDPYSQPQQTVIVGQTSAVPIAAVDPYGQPVVYIQPPSAAAKVIGILCIILGALSILGIFAAFLPQYDVDGNEIDVSATVMALTALSSAVTAGTFILGGVWLMNYQRRGIHLLWAGLGTSVVLGLASFSAGGDGGLNDLVGAGPGFVFVAGVSMICNGLCALIIAIPMMSATGGLDDSRLF